MKDENGKPELGCCVDCGSHEAYLQPCPFAEEICNDDTEMWLCDECAHDRAMEI